MLCTGKKSQGLLTSLVAEFSGQQGIWGVIPMNTILVKCRLKKKPRLLKLQ